MRESQVTNVVGADARIGKGCAKFCRHLSLMVWKNLLILLRNRKVFYTLFFAPFAVFLMLSLLQHVVENSNQWNTVLDPDIDTLPQVAKCSRSPGCYSIGYGIIGPRQDWLNFVLEEVASDQGLSPTDDIFHVYSGENNTEFLKYFADHEDRFDHAILFCTSKFQVTSNQSIPCTSILDQPIFFYNLLFNISDLTGLNSFSVPRAPLPRDFAVVSLKLSVDNAIARWVAKQQGIALPPRIKATAQDYPKLPNRGAMNYDIMTDTGAFYIYIIPMLLFMTVAGELAREKFYKLRLGLTVVGLSESSYWISWALVSLLLSLMNSVMIIIAGAVFQFAFFLKTPALLLLLVLTVFTFSLQMIAFLLVTFSSSMEKANTFSYTFFLLGILFQIFFSKAILLDMLYDVDADALTVFFRRVFFLYPTFHFSKIFGDITAYSGNHFEFTTNTWIEGPGYTWSMLTQLQNGKIFGIKYEAPTTLHSFGYLFVNIEVFTILLWYLDHVLPGNRGRAASLIFFLKPSFWGYRRKKQQATTDEERATETLLSSSSTAPGLLVNAVSKTFRALPCGLGSSRDVRALNEVSLRIMPGELLALLGHNGAGKTLC